MLIGFVQYNPGFKMVSAFLFFSFYFDKWLQSIQQLKICCIQIYNIPRFSSQKKIIFVENREIFLKLFLFCFYWENPNISIHNLGVFIKNFFLSYTNNNLPIYIQRVLSLMTDILYEHKTFFYWLLIAVCVFCVQASKMILRDFNARCLANDPWIKRVPHPLYTSCGKQKGFLSCIIR